MHYRCSSPGQATVADLYCPLHRPFIRQRLQHSVVHMHGWGADIYVEPQLGNIIGSPEGPIQFSMAFQHPVAHWYETSSLLSPQVTLVLPDLTEVPGDIAGYADDLARLRIVPNGLASYALEIMSKDSTVFDNSMARGGYCQNIAKRMVVPSLRSYLQQGILAVFSTGVRATRRRWKKDLMLCREIGANLVPFGLAVCLSKR